MGFILMAGGAFRVGSTQLVSQLEQSEREILKLCLSFGDLGANSDPIPTDPNSDPDANYGRLTIPTQFTNDDSLRNWGSRAPKEFS
jgi:hypothetical protein